MNWESLEGVWAHSGWGGRKVKAGAVPVGLHVTRVCVVRRNQKCLPRELRSPMLLSSRN